MESNYRIRLIRTGLKKLVLAAACTTGLFGTQALAADLSGLMKTIPVFSQGTSKGLFDLERCIIEVDGPSMPFVYRQPDRPQRVTLVWDGTGGMGGVSAAVQIDGLENAKVTFWGREKIMRRIRPCLDITNSD